MGANTSKQDARGGYEWKASGPPSVSLDVLESLQTSPENITCCPEPLSNPTLHRGLTSGPAQTDASRAKLIEQHIQARVAEELKKLQQRETEALRLAHDKMASVDVGGSDGKGRDAAPGPSRFSVGKEVEELRRKLEERKQVRALPDGVEKARSEVIRCLRENDRRPLDCWQEVENFKAEVKKLEKGWVDKVTS
ncbi:MICOS complex subunit mic19 [Tolypocladium paradoxum]|uniref:MICOS complex subunit mic19 n=1 Tax=Tolypocladium paradoxum TaxID=94208 RepID=A0A2S4KVM4_9HYPO|nr:MICOS complex subunit mic19 [Tolypocladium paradoxum]